MQEIDQNHAVFQSMYIDLNEIKQKILMSGFHPRIISIYCDVFNIPDNLTFQVNNGVFFINARHIQVGQGCVVNLDLQTLKTNSFILFTNSLTAPLNVVSVFDQNGGRKIKPFTISVPPVKGGVQISMVGSSVSETDLTPAQARAMTPGQAFTNSMTNEFLYGSLLYDQDPGLALDMMLWIKDSCADSSDLLNTFLRAVSMISLLSSEINAQQNGCAFVPYLTQTVYTNLATAFVAEAKQYESDYMALSKQKVLSDNDIKLAQTLLDNKIYEGDYVAKLLDQAQSNYDNAASAVSVATKNYEAAQLKAQIVQIDFEQVGIPEWERAQILEAVISIATALIQFGVGVGELLAGNPEGGAAATGGAIEGVKAVKDAAETGSEIAETASDAESAMKNLAKTIKALKAIYTLTDTLVSSANSINNAQAQADQMAQMDVVTNGADLSATVQWQIYGLVSDDALKDPVDKGIGYASDLKQAIDEVVIYGQALAAAQLAAIKTGQELARVKMQGEMAKQQEDRLEQYVGSLKEGEAPIVEMMQAFYQRYIDAKSSLFAALKGYQASYFYWALQHSSINPKIIDKVNKVAVGLHDLTSITLDNASALRKFSPPPQTMAQKSIVIDDPEILNKLKSKGTTSWTIPLDSSVFQDLNRVRLSRVRVWLEGTTTSATTYSVYVTIKNAGNFLDRFDGQNYQFTSKPIVRAFEYSVSSDDKGGANWRFDNGDYGYIQIDGSVDQEVSYAYFEPTPFGEWEIDVRSGIDLSIVTKITIVFAGSIIASSGR